MGIYNSIFDLYYLYKADRDRTELSNRYYFGDIYNRFAIALEYGKKSVEVYPSIVFADTVYEAQKIELLFPESSLVIYISEIIDHRERIGKQTLFGVYETEKLVGSFSLYTFSRTKVTIEKHNWAEILETKTATYLIEGDKITFTYEDGTIETKTFSEDGSKTIVIDGEKIEWYSELPKNPN